MNATPGSMSGTKQPEIAKELEDVHIVQLLRFL